MGENEAPGLNSEKREAGVSRSQEKGARVSSPSAASSFVPFRAGPNPSYQSPLIKYGYFLMILLI